MGFILEKIEEAIKELLIGWIESNMTNMFTDVNDKVGTIAAEVGKTPAFYGRQPLADGIDLHNIGTASQQLLCDILQFCLCVIKKQ